jgi:hypothetical protein
MKEADSEKIFGTWAESVYVNDPDICTSCRGLFEEGKESFREDIRPKVVNGHAILHALRVHSWLS